MREIILSEQGESREIMLKNMNITKLKSILKNCSGFTLVEVLVTTGVSVIALVMVIQVFTYCSSLAGAADNTSRMLSEAQDKLEEMRNYTYTSIATDYASGGAVGNTFDLTTPTGKGIIYMDSSNASLLQITVVVCWREDNTRIMGEDLDLDGVLDAGEDVDGNSQISSPVKLVTYLAKRS